MLVTAELGAVRIGMPTFTSLDPNGKHLYLIDNDEHDGVLMKLHYVQVGDLFDFLRRSLGKSGIAVLRFRIQKNRTNCGFPF